jgi:amino acid transporter
VNGPSRLSEQDAAQEALGPEERDIAPRPSDQLPALDPDSLERLRQVGRHWARVLGSAERWRRALPIDPSLGAYPSELRHGRFTRLVPIASADGEPPPLEATELAEVPPSPWSRVVLRLRRVLLGPPLTSTAIAVERMRKLVALPVLSADALSSVAYGPEAMLAVLVLAGSAGLNLLLPISGVIVLLMLAVGASYRQTIRAYPHGGGSYIVASDNLGRVPGLFAGAGLMTDYVLTVAVSIASGVAAITSAAPSLRPAAVPIGVGVIVILLAGNLRGVREAGAAFAIPTYAFIVAILAVIAVGLVDASSRGFSPRAPPPVSATEAVGVLLVLRAFASGSTAMTGVEAISNAVPAFQPPEWRNARTTLTWMIGVLILLFVGVVLLIHLDGVIPKAHETVLSQLARQGLGSGPMYVYVQAATAAVLLLAANTAYNDFPRLLYFMARDFYAPRLFLRMGDRLAFSNGIVALSIVATVIFVSFGGRTESLIPLYAVGVFLAFTLSQSGMVVHWWRRREAHWRRSLLFNATGAALSAIVFVIAGATKFTEGGWVAVIGIPLLVTLALRIHHHYELELQALRLDPLPDDGARSGLIPAPADRSRPSSESGSSEPEAEESPEQLRHLFIVPVASLDRATLRALAYAASHRHPVLALHLSPSEDEAERFRQYWRTWGDHLPLEVIVSPYRAIAGPMVHYIAALHEQHPDMTITVVFPELVVRRWWHRPLHSNIAARVKRALRSLPGVVIVTVPFHLPC